MDLEQARRQRALETRRKRQLEATTKFQRQPVARPKFESAKNEGNYHCRIHIAQSILKSSNIRIYFYLSSFCILLILLLSCKLCFSPASLHGNTEEDEWLLNSSLHLF